MAAEKKQDPRLTDASQIFAYKPLVVEDNSMQYSVFAFLLAMLGLFYASKYLCWLALYCSVIQFANAGSASRSNSFGVTMVSLIMTYSKSGAA